MQDPCQNFNSPDTKFVWIEPVALMEKVLKSKLVDDDEIKQHLIDTGDIDVAEAVVKKPLNNR